MQGKPENKVRTYDATTKNPSWKIDDNEGWSGLGKRNERDDMAFYGIYY